MKLLPKPADPASGADQPLQLLATEPLVQAAQQRSVPLTVLDLAGLSLPDAYRHKLVLCRQDQHVAWRGDQLPDDPAALVERLRGARASR